MLYKFKVVNWKSNHIFYIWKRFPSAYRADRWACRFLCRESQYLVALIPCAEIA